jgi:hypothetical protein
MTWTKIPGKKWYEDGSGDHPSGVGFDKLPAIIAPD